MVVVQKRVKMTHPGLGRRMLASPASLGTLPGAVLWMLMEKEDGEVGEVGEEVVKQGEGSPQPV